MHLLNIRLRYNHILRLKKNNIMSTDVVVATRNLIELSKKKHVIFDRANAVKSDIKFKVFTNESLKGTHATEGNIQSFALDASTPTKIFIHGWNSNLKSNWYDSFRDQYFKKGKHNVIYIDWFEPGSKEYRISAANVKPVGRFIGDFVAASKINLKNIHLIGKSLGAHVASYTGKRVQELTGSKLGRITGLDPAAPSFEVDGFAENNRLNKEDAEFVDVVHTDAGFYGFQAPLGTVDFYPNGGGLQPGCSEDESGHDNSHGRSNWYFLESIASTGIQARKAKSWKDYQKGKYSDEDPIIFGENVPTTASGIYYFETNASKPYTVNKL